MHRALYMSSSSGSVLAPAAMLNAAAALMMSRSPRGATGLGRGSWAKRGWRRLGETLRGGRYSGQGARRHRAGDGKGASGQGQLGQAKAQGWDVEARLGARALGARD